MSDQPLYSGGSLCDGCGESRCLSCNPPRFNKQVASEQSKPPTDAKVEKRRSKSCSWCRTGYPVSNGGYHKDSTGRLVLCLDDKDQPKSPVFTEFDDLSVTEDQSQSEPFTDEEIAELQGNIDELEYLIADAPFRFGGATARNEAISNAASDLLPALPRLLAERLADKKEIKRLQGIVDATWVTAMGRTGCDTGRTGDGLARFVGELATARWDAQAIVDKLHTTKDRKPITPNMVVHYRVDGPTFANRHIKRGTVQREWLREEDGLIFVMVKHECGSSMKWTGDLYSTREAAGKAGQVKETDDASP